QVSTPCMTDVARDVRVGNPYYAKARRDGRAALQRLSCARPVTAISTMSRSTLTLLGTGISMGVPMIGCDCEVCRSTNPRNQRTRTGVLVETPDGNFLIDTSPELRLQLVRERVQMIEAVLFTHAHADHILGLDDLRIFG